MEVCVCVEKQKPYCVLRDINKDPRTFKMADSIDLGYMSIEDGKWSSGYCYCNDCEQGEKCDPCSQNLECDEVIIPFQTITVVYDYPFKDSFPHEHKTTNPNGFTRKEISEQIMARYVQMYQQEDQDVSPTRNMSAVVMNRKRSEGRYGIWGHHISDLKLHSLQRSLKKSEYYIGVDS
jgi:hypothetical protein